MSSGYADLDQLILRCRDERAKSYIIEAVSCYRSGAYKSSIVATYIAVCYDLIDKFRELSLSGDPAAQEHTRKIEVARKSNDFRLSLQLERDYLLVARDTFELISPLEYVDLDRLREDRNRCAHPAILSDEDVFEPSAELARLHIRSAVSRLLEHPPAQGKAAQERIFRDISSEYFPESVEKARIALAESPLRKARTALVRNVLIVILKKLLLSDISVKLYRRNRAALGAVREMFIPIFEEVCRIHLSALFLRVADDKMDSCLNFLTSVKDVWQYLTPAARQRTEAYVTDIPSESLYKLEEALTFSPLRECAIRRCSKANLDEITLQMWFSTPAPLLDRLIVLYKQASSYAAANKVGTAIHFCMDTFTFEQAMRILDCGKANDQVRDSHEFKTVIVAMRKRFLERIPELEEAIEARDLVFL